MELKCNEERRLRLQSEDALTKEAAELQRKQREMDETVEMAVREALRKQRQQQDEDTLEKQRQRDRLALEIQDTLRSEVQALKRKVDEGQREQDILKRKVALSRDEVRLEFQAELENAQQQTRELQEQERLRGGEVRQLREELLQMQQKYALATQQLQQSSLEAQALQQQQQTMLQETATQNTAFLQATQRAIVLEQELAHVRANKEALQREKDRLEIELKKVQAQTSIQSDAQGQHDQEMRRLKQRLQQENQRLQSRVTELEAMQGVWQEQVARQEFQETQQLRQKLVECDRLESDKRRLEERLSQSALREDELASRVRQQEKEVLAQQEALHRKEKALQDESARNETLRQSIQGIRREYERQIDSLQSQVQRLEEEKSHLQSEHAQAVQKFQDEVAQKIPRLITSALEKAEANWQEQSHERLEALTKHYEVTLQKKQQEILQVQTEQAEKAAKERMRAADERMEMEKLRAFQRQSQVLLEEKETQVMEMKRQLRVYENLLGSQQQHPPNALVSYDAVNRSQQQQQQQFVHEDDSWYARGNHQQPQQHHHVNSSRIGMPLHSYTNNNNSFDFTGLVDQSFGDLNLSAANNARSSTPSLQRVHQNHMQNHVQMQMQMPPPPPPRTPQQIADEQALQYLTQQLSLMKQQISHVLPVATHAPASAVSQSRGEAERKSAAAAALLREEIAHLQPLQQSSQQQMKSVKFSPYQHESDDANVDTEMDPQTAALFRSPQAPSREVARAVQRVSLQKSDVNEAEVQDLLQGLTALSATNDASAQDGSAPPEAEALYDPLATTMNHVRANLNNNSISVTANRKQSSRSSGSDMIQNASFDSAGSSRLADGYFPPSYTPKPSTAVAGLTSNRGAKPTVAMGGASSRIGAGNSSYVMDMSMISTTSSVADVQAGAVEDFSAISDGGYHPGYWRAKYTSSRR